MRVHRIPLASLCISIALAGLVSWPSTSHADQDGIVLEDVRMGEPGDRWLDLMPLRRIERSTIDGVFGYAVAYDGVDGGEQVFFFPRSVIDLAGEKPLATRVTIEAKGGRIWYPDRITAGATVKRVSASTGSSPRALARALEGAGYTRPPETAVHHIVAHTAKGAEPAREVLRSVGIGIDDVANGVFLPATTRSANSAGSAVHSTLHTGKYYEEVNRLLELATTRAEVEALLMSIRVRLLMGTMVR